jgi:N-acyl-D-aspartate/D-glutamate deacylase
MHDRVLRGGRVIDGTGAAGRTADVAIDNGRITLVGRAGPGREEIDCDGLIVTPGFVDPHTHYDGQATWDPDVTPSGWHGVTTVVMGNCGVGFAPARKADRDWIVQVMEGVEDIPGSALHEGIRWGWETFPEYLDALERLPRSLDIGAQVPHAAVRAWVMGARAAEDEPATAADIAAMRALVAEGLRAGALGFTTSRTSLHKTKEGKFVAGTFSEVEELEGICAALGEVGHGVFGCADEHVMLPSDLPWLRGIAARTQRPVIANLSQSDFAPEVYREVVAGLESAAADGVPLYAQVAGRAIGILMHWRGTAHPFALHPTWKALAARPWEEAKAALRDPAVRAKLIAEAPEEAGMFEFYVTRTFEKMYPFHDASDYEPDPSTSVAAVAARTGRAPLEVAYDALMENDADGWLYFPIFNYSHGSLDLLHSLHQHPRTLFGLSDGGAHCGAICDGGMPTFMLTHWARDRSRGDRLPLEHVIRRQTRDTAWMYGLRDRGVLAPGMRADINVIDLDRLAVLPPTMAWDLPAGGRRLIQRAQGYRATLLAGALVREFDEATGIRPGKVIRGPQAALEG